MRSVLNAVAAVVVSAALLGVLGFGYGTIPALGPALDPGRGAWTSASGGQPASSQTLHVPGLTAPVSVSYSSQGLASIDAANTHDLFLAMGYVHAKFRLSEMDLERRLGEGRLAQLAGRSDLSSDEFELRLGLLRTAQNEWARTTGQARAALLAYAQGVNDDIAAVRAAGDWPAVFTLTGSYPTPWTPVDSLVIQGVLTQELDYTTGPLDQAVLARSLGAARTTDWLPVLAKNAQTPYDPGPYVKAPLTPVAPDAASSAPGGSRSRRRPLLPRGTPPDPPRTVEPLGRSDDPRRSRPRRHSSSTSSASCPRTRSTSTRTATRGRRTDPRCKPAGGRGGPSPLASRAGPCWAVTRTCRRRNRRCGTRWPCPRRGTRCPASACRVCRGSCSGTTRTSRGR